MARRGWQRWAWALPSSVAHCSRRAGRRAASCSRRTHCMSPSTYPRRYACASRRQPGCSSRTPPTSRRCRLSAYCRACRLASLSTTRTRQAAARSSRATSPPTRASRWCSSVAAARACSSPAAASSPSAPTRPPALAAPPVCAWPHTSRSVGPARSSAHSSRCASCALPSCRSRMLRTPRGQRSSRGCAASGARRPTSRRGRWWWRGSAQTSRST